MSLPAEWRAALDVVAGAAKQFKDPCFRSVEIAYAHPDDVISGEGARLHGGRFAPPGVRAVFASLDEETSTREATVRKRRLGGRAQIPLKAYPRFTYVIAIEMVKCVDFRSVDPGSDLGRALAAACRAKRSGGLAQAAAPRPRCRHEQQECRGRTKRSILNEEDDFQDKVFLRLKRPFSRSIITAEAPRARRGHTAFSGQAPTFNICFIHRFRR